MIPLQLILCLEMLLRFPHPWMEQHLRWRDYSRSPGFAIMWQGQKSEPKDKP